MSVWTSTKKCGSCGSTEGTGCDNCGDCTECHDCMFCEGCDAFVDNLSECGITQHCASCCQHQQCQSCGKYHTRFGRELDFCGNCENCTDCCECFFCGACGGECSDNHCYDCDNCHDCCECHGGGECGILTAGSFKFHTADKLEFKTNKLSRYLSLELEIDAAREPSFVGDACESWDDPIVEDGSLSESGFEINTNPSNGDVFLKHIREISTSFKTAGAEVNSRCGMHVHVSAGDYGWFDLYKLCKVYAKIEDSLYEIVSSSRDGNRYSERCADKFSFSTPKGFKKALLERIYGRTFDPEKDKHNVTYKKAGRNKVKKVFSEKGDKYHPCRYSALNIHSYFYRGTIEFRHHQGTTDYTKATNWAMVCGHIVDYASRANLKDISALPHDSWDAFMAILPEELQAWCKLRKSELGDRRVKKTVEPNYPQQQRTQEMLAAPTVDQIPYPRVFDPIIERLAETYNFIENSPCQDCDLQRARITPEETRRRRLDLPF